MSLVLVGDKQKTELRQRLEKFFALTPWELVSHKEFGPPKGLCPDGLELYESACFSANEEDFLFAHIKNAKCGCKKALFHHIIKVTD